MKLQNNRFCIAGIPVEDIANRYDTPLYVYHTDTIVRQYRKMEAAFKNVKSRICYACKALTNINILKLMRELGAGLDTVSIYEVETGLRAGFNPEEIIFTPNGVGMDEIQKAVELGVHVNIDNIPTLERFGHKYSGKYPVCLRLNPHIMAGGHYQISTGHIDSKFGISVHQLRHVERIVKSTGIHVNGLHMHTGSEIMDAGVFLRGVEILLEATQYFKKLAFIDLGSGFKVPYSTEDNSTDMVTLGNELTARFRNFFSEYGKEVELWFEPGKFLVSEAGIFLVKVNVVKQTTATVFALVNSGFNHLIRPMFYDAYHHIINISNPKGVPRIYTVAGNICETDTFAWDRKIAEIREGDLLAIMNAGAYGYEMAMNYNSRPRPAEVMVYKGKDYLIRKRETLDDLLRNQVEPVIL
ncbi:MAG: diaminopimelate decarboxylase [Bacteroidetes bacterium]|nr:diaminopimelate decarboxylase [Bacteroidota bacterium]